MAQFDVYINPNPNTLKKIPFLLDVQNDILKGLNTRVVVPLVSDMQPAKVLNPTFSINGINVVMSTAQIASISMDNIGMKVCSLYEHRNDIVQALDFMIIGY
jgi:toxin CcdB